METVQPVREEKRTDVLKIIAIVSMLIDHIGHQFFPHIIILRIIGRIAFPIFAFHLVIGYKNTSNLKKYAIRLGLFALISQIPFAFFGRGLNIFVTLLIGILAIYLYENNRNLIYILFIGIIGLTYVGIYFDYGLYGVVLILIFYLYFDDYKNLILSFIGITLLYCIEANYYVQMYSLLAIPLFYFKFKSIIKLNKYFFYAFYPVHISVIVILDYVLK